MYERDIQMHAAFAKDSGDFRQEQRRVIRHTFVDGRTDIATDEKGILPEVVNQLRLRIRRGSVGQDVQHLDVIDLGGAGGERFDEDLRRSAARTDKHAHAAAHAFQRLRGVFPRQVLRIHSSFLSKATRGCCTMA